jgi:hypothetical protein
LSRIARTVCSERCAAITDSTNFIGAAAPSTPWMATASPVCSVSTADPIACVSAWSKLGPSVGAAVDCGLRTLALWLAEPDAGNSFDHRLIPAPRPLAIQASFMRLTAVFSMSADCLAT